MGVVIGFPFILTGSMVGSTPSPSKATVLGGSSTVTVELPLEVCPGGSHQWDSFHSDRSTHDQFGPSIACHKAHYKMHTLPHVAEVSWILAWVSEITSPPLLERCMRLTVCFVARSLFGEIAWAISFERHHGYLLTGTRDLVFSLEFARS